MTPLEKVLHEFKTRYSSTQFASWLNSHSEELLNEEKEYIKQQVVKELESIKDGFAKMSFSTHCAQAVDKKIKHLKQ